MGEATLPELVTGRFIDRCTLTLLALVWLGSTSLALAADAGATARLSQRWTRLAGAGDRLVSRELFWFAESALRNGSHATEIEQAFAWAEEMQDRDPDSPTFGNFRWYRANPKPHDKNAVEFCMSTATVTWIHYRDRLTPAARASLERMMRFGAEGLKRHRIGPNYTNIFLEKTWNMIGVGQAMGMPELRKEGEQMLERWLAHAWQNGITEYLSGTYYGVSFGPLEKIAQYAKDETARENANAALRLFWTDVAANWFAPCNRLGGACSREYNFQLGINGSLQERVASALDQNTTQYVPPGADEASWMGPESVRELIGTIPRMVRQRWGSDPSRIASHYVSHRFSIGSAGANYGPMDRPLTVNIAGPARDRAPFITFLMDARGDAYCSKPFRLPSGHAKARHLSPFLASVQNGPEVLLLASDHPKRWTGGYRYENLVPTCLKSHLTFPADMEIWVGNERLDKDEGAFAQPVPPKVPVFLKTGGVTVGVRVVVATSDSVSSVPVELVCDSDGLHRGVMRLTCIHDDSPPKGRGTVALWVAVTETDDPDEIAEFQRCLGAPANVDISGNRVSVSVSGLDRELRIVADAEREERMSLTGADALGPALLTLNGIDLGTQILAASPALQEQRAATERLLRDARAGRIPVLKPNKPLEAEAALLMEGSMKVTPDGNASSEKCLCKPGDPSLARTAGRAVWVLEVPRDGSYYFWARLRALKRGRFILHPRLPGGRPVRAAAGMAYGCAQELPMGTHPACRPSPTDRRPRIFRDPQPRNRHHAGCPGLLGRRCVETERESCPCWAHSVSSNSASVREPAPFPKPHKFRSRQHSTKGHPCKTQSCELDRLC